MMFIVFCAFSLVFSMCCLNVNLVSRVSPRTLGVCVCGISVLLM